MWRSITSWFYKPAPIPAVKNMDLNRFMGDWWVIANVPTPPEKVAYNSCESYKLVEKDKVDITFTFNAGALNGPRTTTKSTGFVSEDPAQWGVQFVWPIKHEFVVAYLDENYHNTIVARSSRDFVWIMSRSKTMDDATYANLVTKVKELGYDVSSLRKVPQM